MRKIILGLVAAAAIAAPLAFATSANAATTDANGVVTVSKGEIMAQFPGMNEKAFQTIAMAAGQSLTGSNVFTATTDHRRGLLGRHHPAPLPQHHHHQPDHAHRGLQRLGRQGHRLDLGAKGASVITEANTYGTASSGRFPNYATICADHGSVTNPSRPSGRATAT